MHKKTQVFVFHFQKQYEFMIFLAEGCIRGSIYDKFTINLQGGYLDQEEIAKIFFLYRNNRENAQDYEAACMLPKKYFTQILLHHTLKTPENL